MTALVACSSSITDPLGSPTPPTGNEGGTVTLDGSGGGCATGATSCSGACVDTNSDPANCGACAKACAAGTVCSKGACAELCPSGQSKCEVGGKAACATLETDRNNCGACGNTCAAGELCSAGKCALTCQASYTACSGKPFVPDAGADAGDAAVPDAGSVAPYCAKLQTSEDDCGVCGKSCAANQKCSAGLCCAQGTLSCGGASCIDVTSDSNNCGACANKCGVATPYCIKSACTNLYSPTGIQKNIEVADLAGWTECYKDDYNPSVPIATVKAACAGSKIMIGCKKTASTAMSVLAWAPRDDVFFVTPNCDNTPHNANGVNWYFSESCSMGFAPEGSTISRNTCDVSNFNDGIGDKKMCWHTSGGNLTPGWRCGDDTGVYGTSQRVIYSAP